MSPEGLDRAAVEALFVRLERPVYNVVYRWLWDRAEARDVVQEAFVRLWGARDRVRPDTAEALVFRIALNLASNRRRRRRLWGLVGLDPARPAEAQAADDQLAEAARDQALRAAVERLPEKLRRVIVLCELSGLGYAQVAVVLGIPEGTVGSRRNAGLARLREWLVAEADHG